MGAHLARRELLLRDAPMTVVPVAARTFRPPVVARERRLELKMEPQDGLLLEWRAALPPGRRDEWELVQAHLAVAWLVWAWPPQALLLRVLALQEPQPLAPVPAAEQQA